MDETPVWFDMPAKRTIDRKGSKRVPILTTGNEKKRVTLVLCCSNKGDKMQPALIVRGQSDQHSTSAVLNGVRIWHQPKGWMNSELMLRWLSQIYAGAAESNRDILVLDSFSGHKSASVKACYRERSIKVAVIPGGCTPYLQPLDIAVNRSFKASLKRAWNALMQSRASANQCIDLDQLTRWISEIWRDLSPVIIKNGFRKAFNR